ncbi:MAG TPA: cobalamin biosynthesis protein, partial [Candidatus Tenderia electrophaga]|nr:cobalamin biosynthesis protein [Candidatus Tenderia electrophaga]
MTALMVAIALLLDRLLGEATRWHPLVGFGRLVKWLEQFLWRDDCRKWQARWRGAVAVTLLLLPLTLVTAWLARFVVLEYFIAILLLYLAIGGRSLA